MFRAMEVRIFIEESADGSRGGIRGVFGVFSKCGEISQVLADFFLIFRLTFRGLGRKIFFTEFSEWGCAVRDLLEVFGGVVLAFLFGLCESWLAWKATVWFGGFLWVPVFVLPNMGLWWLCDGGVWKGVWRRLGAGRRRRRMYGAGYSRLTD